MAKKSGLGQNFYVGGYDLSGDVGAITNASSTRTTLDVTGIDKSAVERVMGPGDASMEFMSFFNDAAGQQHLALRGLVTTDLPVTWALGTTIGDAAASFVGKLTNYPLARASDGSLTATPTLVANDGVPMEWGVMLTGGVETDTGAANGSSHDNGAATSNGLVAYLHVFSFTGTAVVVKIQSSSDDGSGDAFADIVTFTSVNAANKFERKELSGAVERYLRVVTTGTFNPATFAVMVRRGTAQDDTAY
jgi:hypothetical protein